MAKITEEIEREKEMQAWDHSLVINLLSNNMFYGGAFFIFVWV